VSAANQRNKCAAMRMCEDRDNTEEGCKDIISGPQGDDAGGGELIQQAGVRQ